MQVACEVKNLLLYFVALAFSTILTNVLSDTLTTLMASNAYKCNTGNASLKIDVSNNFALHGLSLPNYIRISLDPSVIWVTSYYSLIKTKIITQALIALCDPMHLLSTH